MEGVSASAAAAVREVSPYPVPRVLRESNFPRRAPLQEGYSPVAAVRLAAAHRWATYSSFMSVLRDLMLVDFQDSTSRSSAQRSLISLSQHGVPFDMNCRFPDDEIYVGVDRPPMSFLVLRLSRALAMEGKDGNEFYDAVHDTMHVVMCEGLRSPPVMYGRSVLEAAFRLQWVESII